MRMLFEWSAKDDIYRCDRILFLLPLFDVSNNTVSCLSHINSLSDEENEFIIYPLTIWTLKRSFEPSGKE